MSESKLHIITAIKSGSRRTETITMPLLLLQPPCDVESAIREACSLYINGTTEGWQEYRNNNDDFDDMDFWACVPNEICEQCCFRKLDEDASIQNAEGVCDQEVNAYESLFDEWDVFLSEEQRSRILSEMATNDVETNREWLKEMLDDDEHSDDTNEECLQTAEEILLETEGELSICQFYHEKFDEGEEA